MTASLSALLANSLDYAGLFPPAGLDMPGAVAEYERHVSNDPVRMVAGFVCPATRLDELAQSAGGRSWKLSILGSSAASPQEALLHAEDDMQRIAAFMQANRGFTISALEFRVPASLLDSPHLEEFPRVVEMLFNAEPQPNIFYELGWTAAWATVFPRLRQGARMFCGAKVRTGGVEPSAFPAPEQLATFMIAAREARFPWKATAGLHHPLRRFHGEVGTKMHGFLNVFLAAGLAWKGSDEATLIDILNEEDASAFRFEDERVIWRDHVLDAEQIHSARSDFALSFGSCSYQEPIDDLKELGLL
jgi:hypothetical protein